MEVKHMNKGTVSPFVFLALFCVLAYYFFRASQRGFRVSFRQINGLSAIEEAVGRATEVGRPVHYTFGAGPMDAGVLASFEVLKHTASLTARMRVPLYVTVCLAEEHPIAEEIVRRQYVVGGAADAFDPRTIIFLAGNKEAYQAGVISLLEREKVAASFLIGSFQSDALTLAEVGQNVGAIQVAATASTLQLPFFVAACDYTLAGEELFAASALLSGSNDRVGTLIAQDILKYLIIGIILMGSLMNLAGDKTLIQMLQL
jgi:hypothetical protein